MSEGIAHQYLAFMKLSGNPFCLQMCFFFFKLSIAFAVVEGTVSITACLFLESQFQSLLCACTWASVYVELLRCVCAVHVCVALLKACCLWVQQAAHTPLFSIGETGCVVLHFRAFRLCSN